VGVKEERSWKPKEGIPQKKPSYLLEKLKMWNYRKLKKDEK
jgi:hypothetical protein